MLLHLPIGRSCLGCGTVTRAGYSGSVLHELVQLVCEGHIMRLRKETDGPGCSGPGKERQLAPVVCGERTSVRLLIETIEVQDLFGWRTDLCCI